MRKIKNVILITIFMLLIGVSFNVYAEEFNYYLSNSDANYEYVDKGSTKTKNIKRGDVIYVTSIVDNKDNVSDYQISSGKLTIRWDEKYLSLQEVNGKYYNDAASDVSGLSIESVSKGTNKLTIGSMKSTGALKSGKNQIIEFKFLVINDAPAGDTKVYQMDGEDNLKCYNQIEDKTISCGESLYSELKYSIQKSTVNKLTSIKINGYAVENFDENKNDYDFHVDTNVEKVNIEVTRKDTRSTISGNYGDNNIKYGTNKLAINVTSESGEKNTYNINVIREDSRSGDNLLKTLTISSGELEFKPTVSEYNITVDNEIDKITITSSLNDSKAKYVEDYRNKEIELNEGSNKVEIKVISEKGEERVYTLNINRALSSNNSLKYIKVNDEKITVKEAEFTYYVEVENEVDEVIVKAETNDTKATVDLKDKYPLEIGDNEIIIKVTAAGGNEAIYTLYVTRKKLLSKDSLLTNITIKGYDIDFKQSTNTYDLKIKDNEEELEITTTQEDPNATVEIEGNKDLVDGSIIKINVKAEDGSFTRYFIRIEKGSSGTSPIVIILIVLFILLGICIGLIIYLKKKKEKAKFDKMDKETEVKDDNLKENNEVEEETTIEEEKEKPVETELSNEEQSVRNNLLEKGAHEYTGEHEQIEKTDESEVAEEEKKDVEE